MVDKFNGISSIRKEYSNFKYTSRELRKKLSSNGSLYLSGKKLTELPELPDDLKILDCQNNQLTKLPKLPDGLRTLFCNNNQLTELPPLPNSLEILDCENNKLTELPNIPNNLEILDCRNNELVYSSLDIKTIENEQLLIERKRKINKFNKRKRKEN